MLRTALLLTLLSLILVPTALAASAGDLDPSFDGDGKAILPFFAPLADVLVQPDGKLVLAGTSSEDFGVWRLNGDGSPDRAFDDDGAAFADFGGSDVANAAALQPDGKILVTGSAPGPGVARFTPGGSLDPTFGPGGDDGDGKVILPDSDFDSADAVIAQGGGRIALAGSWRPAGESTDFVIILLRPDGSPEDDTAPEPADFGGDERVMAAAPAPNGKIVVVGTSRPEEEPSSETVAVARYNGDGTLDETFADSGKKTLGPGTPASVLAQPDGKVLVVVLSERGDPSVTRLTSEGDVDTAFGQGGTADGGFAGEKAAFDVAAALRQDGRIFVTGTALGAMAFAVGRLGPSGMPDTSFGLGGSATIPFDSVALAAAAAAQPDGKLVVAGGTLVGGVPKLAVVRLLGDAPQPTAQPLPVKGRAPRCAGRVATIVGTAGRDTLRGTRRADVIAALGGSDRVLARGGNDLVCGGTGSDRLSGGPGRDVLTGGAGRDRLDGGAGRDRCVGAAGPDRAAGCERRRSL